MKKYDTVVIGSGVSGLTSALILAQNGKHVALVEQDAHLSPLLRRFKRGGVWCDAGFHYSSGLETSGTLTVLFNYLGLSDQLEIIPFNAECFDIAAFEGEDEYRLPYGYDRLGDYLCSRFPQSQKAIQTYISKLSEIRQQTAFLNYDLDFSKITDAASSNKSLKDFLLEAGAESGLIRLLGHHGLVLYGADETEIPFFTHAFIMGSFYQSASALSRGGDSIVQAFQRRLKAEGVDIYCNDPVIGLEIGDKREMQAALTQNGQRLECTNCISTIHPQLLIKLLPVERIRPAFINRVRNLENTFSPFIIFYNLETVPEKLNGKNYYIFPAQKETNSIKEYMALMAVHPQTETGGKKSLAVITPCGLDVFQDFFEDRNTEANAAYYQLKNELAEHTTERVLQYFPELKERICMVGSASPVTYQRYTGTVQGSIYGVKQSVHQQSLSNLTPVHGLYLAGQSLQCGVMGAVISSFMAVCHILDPVKLRSDILKCQ